MALPCSISDWSCPYHACMTDDCQKSNVISSGADWGKGNCKELTAMKTKVKEGQVFDHFGEKFKAVAGKTCKGCAFKKVKYEYKCMTAPSCNGDEDEFIFEKLEEQK